MANNDQKIKRRRLDIFDEKFCIFCENKFKTDQSNATRPDINRLDKLFDACTKRNDEIGKKLLENMEAIKDGTLVFRYHRDCRSTYTSNLHVNRVLKDEQLLSDEPQKPDRVTRRSGDIDLIFDWKINCFICGKFCNPKNKPEWSMVASSIDTSEQSLYTRVLTVAENINDTEMVARLGGVPNGDLVAIEARYHRKKPCVQSYTRQSKSQTNVKDSNIFDTAFQTLVTEIKPDILNDEVFLMSSLLERYKELVRSKGVNVEESERYKAHNLKIRFMNYIDLNIEFIPQPGLSDIMVGSHVTVGQAILKAKELVDVIQEVSDRSFEKSDDKNNNTTDISILHVAAGILRRRMTDKKKLEGEYYAFDEMTLHAEKEFVDVLLYNFICWLTDADLYKSGSFVYGRELNAKCLHIACDITTEATSVMSPKHLGLGVYLHHDLGNRSLVENMYNMGYSISYDEVRKFTTSAALHVNTMQTPTEHSSYIPPEITPIHQGGSWICASADNWDHNERTTDGKGTTHAMTSIIVQPISGQVIPSSQRLKRSKTRSLDSEIVTGGDLSKIIRYKNPPIRPEPTFIPPVLLSEFSSSNSDEYKEIQLTEDIYSISRSGVFHDVETEFPTWKQYNIVLSKDFSDKTSRVAFNPIIMANPTEKSTVFTTLLRLKETANILGQKYIPVFFDMGLLTKALEITWSEPKTLEGVIPCEGGMHLLMSLFTAIGFIYGDAGLKNILNSVFAAGTVNSMLAGKDFERAMYGFKILDEALHARMYYQFQIWCEKSTKIIPTNFSELLNEFETAVAEGNEQGIPNFLIQFREIINKKIGPLFDEFLKEGRSASPTFRFWDDFRLNILRTIKVFINSTRTGNWVVQQEAKKRLLPFFFVSNRTNYARYMTVLIALMNRLPSTVHEKFTDGEFVAKLTSGKFNSVWMDYTIEVTENKALKGNGGIIGLTLKGPALLRWFMSRPITSQYTRQFKINIAEKRHSKNKEKPKEKNGATASQKKWTRDVKKMYEAFDGSLIDPFDLKDAPSTLVNIGTGAEAPKEVEKGLLNMFQKGTDMMTKFVKERLIDPTPNENTEKKSFYDTLGKSKIKTMTAMKTTVKIGKKNVTIDGEIMYLRILAVNAKKKVPITRVMSYENAPVPLSMFNEDGTMISSAKSNLLPCLEGLQTSKRITGISNCDVMIFDGHAVIQSLQSNSDIVQSTFEDKAREFFYHIKYLSKKTNNGKPVREIHIAFDRYFQDSIKGQTRAKRNENPGIVFNIRKDINIPQNWKQFLANSENKENLAHFYTEHISGHQEFLEPNQTIYISGGKSDKTVRITPQDVTDIRYLESNHEEADSRIILHAVDASRRSKKTLVIFSPDTDVLVLLIHHRSKIPSKNIYFLTGHSGIHINHERYIPVHELHRALTIPQRDILLVVYCLTGCDSTSSFFGHGKKGAFKKLSDNAWHYQVLATLGSTPMLTAAQFSQCVRFIGELYGKKNCSSLNSLRCEKAENSVPGKRLPPTEDSFRLHILRCIYQLVIWKNAHVAVHDFGDLNEFGYEKDESGHLQPKMFNQAPAVPELLNAIVCSCKTSCADNCSCESHLQACTSACGCEGSVDELEEMCQNQFTLQSMAQQLLEDGFDSDEE